MLDLEKHISNINNNGLTIIKNGIDNDLVDRVVNDFDYWSSLPKNEFVKFKSDRVTNFHIYSKNTLDLVTNKYVNELLKKLFNREQAIYSSLFFREGTSQHYHRDTPHFYTNPIDQYYGIWYALQDININAGPLKYYIGSHKLEVPNGYDTFNKVYNNVINKDNIKIASDYRCIIEYNKVTEDLCKKNNLMYIDETNYIDKINKGDIIIWHPKLLHGGSNILDPTCTRYSMVTHNVPINTAVFNAEHFFAEKPTKLYLENKLKHKYILHNNINIFDHNVEPRVQKSYV
jgi:ectoine hydroxylase-related dioxygenase (phytanoyl-CoA dioxygenase family)